MRGIEARRKILAAERNKTVDNLQFRTIIATDFDIVSLVANLADTRFAQSST